MASYHGFVCISLVISGIERFNSKEKRKIWRGDWDILNGSSLNINIKESD